MLPFELSPAEWQAAGLSQLRMGYTRFDAMPPARPVEGYALRTFRPGDEPAWLDILSTGDFGVWDRARLDRMLAGERAPVPFDGVVFATWQGVPVGAACTTLYEGDEGPYSELGWVAVWPEHRGRGLGYEVCRGVLEFAQAAGHRYTFLKTDDFRLAAIKTYLRLGFQPELLDPGQEVRWSDLRRVTGMA